MNLEEWLNEVPPADWVEPEDVSGHLLSREQLESLWQAAHAEGVAEGRAAERKKWQDENSTLRKRLETRTQISRQWEALAERNRLERTAATAAEREDIRSLIAEERKQYKPTQWDDPEDYHFNDGAYTALGNILGRIEDEQEHAKRRQGHHQ